MQSEVDPKEIKTQQILDTIALVADKGTKLSDEKMLSINGMSYIAQPALHTVRQRSLEKQAYVTNSYTAGDTMSFVFRSNDGFINAKNSGLLFKCYSPNVGGADTADEQVYFGSNGALGLFQSSVCTASAGTEIVRHENLHYWNSLKGNVEGGNSRVLQNYLMGKPTLANTAVVYEPVATRYLTSTEAATGTVSPAVYAGAQRVNAASSGAAKTFFVPLSKLSSLFNTDQLLPSWLMSALKFDLILAPGKVALTTGSTDGTAAAAGTDIYYVLSPSLIIDYIYPTEAMSKVLASRAAKSGLELEITPQSWAGFTTAATSNSLTINRNFGHVKNVYLQQYVPIDATTANEMKYDTFITATNNVLSFQAKCGSYFWPQQVVSGSTTDKRELYLSTFLIPSNAKRDSEMSYWRWFYTAPIFIAPLERSNILTHSGVGISSSRNIQLDLVLDTASTCGFNVFLEYTEVIEIYSDGRVLVRV